MDEEIEAKIADINTKISPIKGNGSLYLYKKRRLVNGPLTPPAFKQTESSGGTADLPTRAIIENGRIALMLELRD